MDSGEEPVEDPEELAQLRRQARAVYLRSAAAAVVLTLAALLVPAL